MSNIDLLKEVLGGDLYEYKGELRLYLSGINERIKAYLIFNKEFNIQDQFVPFVDIYRMSDPKLFVYDSFKRLKKGSLLRERDKWKLYIKRKLYEPNKPEQRKEVKRRIDCLVKTLKSKKKIDDF